MRESDKFTETLTAEELINFPEWKKKTALFLFGQTISLFGSSLVQFAIIWYITLNTQSGVMMAISTICGFAPQIVISLFSGVWADRYHRKKLIMGADALVATATFVLFLLFMNGRDDFWMIFLVSAVRSLGAGIQTPAVSALLPQIVPPKRLIRIGGLNGSLNSVMFLLSPAAGGAILSRFDFEYTLLVDIVTAAIAIVIMAFIKVPIHEKALKKERGNYFGDMKAGLLYIGRNPFLRSLFIYLAIFMFMLVPAAQLTPLMVSRTFGNDVLLLSYTEVAFSIGSIAGGVVITIWGGFKNRMHTIALSCIVFGVLAIFMGVVPAFMAFLIVTAMAGISVPFFSTPATVLLQEQIAGDMQGRVFSLVQLIITTAVPLGMAVFGPLADKVSVQILLYFTGAVITVLGVLVLLNKHFKRGLISD